MRRVLTSLLILILLGALALFGGALWWLHEPLELRLQPGSKVLDLEIEPGNSAAGVASAVVASGVDTPVLLLQTWFRVSGQARLIKAGSYEVTLGATPRKLLRWRNAGS